MRQVGPPAEREPFLALERYGLIGDCGTAALVSDEGSIDWLCLPSFDSDPVFARLLDPTAGHFSIRPDAPFSVSRRYVPDTAVLATTFSTAEGRASLYDFFAARPGPAKRRGLWPFRYLVRRVEGEEGRVRFRVELAPRDAFGRGSYRVAAAGRRLTAQLGGRALLAEASIPFEISERTALATLEVGAGQRQTVALAYSDRDLAVWPPAGEFAEEAFRETVDYWREWACRESLRGRESDLVRRSAITLKLLTYAPSGGVIAAPTTSLPESPGDVRNWDYRYVWVRDASWTISALFSLGYEEEARAYRFWVTNAARLSEPRIRTMYSLHGSHQVPEAEVPGLRGYLDSRPVRRGNAASDQLQLDNWGHLVEGIFIYAMRAGHLDAGTWSSLRAYVQFVADNWSLPDRGIWEVRGEAKHFVHSKVMCWVALDRGLRLARAFNLPAPLERWERERQELCNTLLKRGVDSATGSFTRAFGDSEVDASLLQIPLVRFLPGDDPRVVRTVQRIREELGSGELLYRYRTDDGLPGREGRFLACSFWLAHALALAGRLDDACSVFEAACRRANDLGLLPEEIGTDGRFLGNFPQGLSHIALVNAAAAIQAAERAIGG